MNIYLHKLDMALSPLKGYEIEIINKESQTFKGILLSSGWPFSEGNCIHISGTNIQEIKITSIDTVKAGGYIKYESKKKLW